MSEMMVFYPGEPKGNEKMTDEKRDYRKVAKYASTEDGGMSEADYGCYVFEDDYDKAVDEIDTLRVLNSGFKRTIADMDVVIKDQKEAIISLNADVALLNALEDECAEENVKLRALLKEKDKTIHKWFVDKEKFRLERDRLREKLDYCEADIEGYQRDRNVLRAGAKELVDRMKYMEDGYCKRIDYLEARVKELEKIAFAGVH